MIALEYAPSFLRQLKKLPPELQREATEKVRLFKDRRNHQRLEVHKLKGRLAGKWSFSVNYAYRIVFIWTARDTAGLLAIDDHDVYR